MKLVKTNLATIYTFESSSELHYRITCEDGLVSMIEKCEVVWQEGGDAESGPRMFSGLATSIIEPSDIRFERDLETCIDAIITDAEAYTLHCLQIGSEP